MNDELGPVALALLEILQEDREQRGTLGATMLRLRERRDMSQKELARKSNVSQSTLSRMEHGLTYPRRHTLTRVASALGVTVNELETGRRPSLLHRLLRR